MNEKFPHVCRFSRRDKFFRFCISEKRGRRYRDVNERIIKANNLKMPAKFDSSLNNGTFVKNG